MQSKDFFITTIGGLADPSDLLVTEDTLNRNLNIANFGKGVQQIAFIGLVYEKANEIHQPFWKYDPSSRKIEGSFPLDFPKAATFMDRAAQRLVCDAIFELFDKVADQVKDFDFAALKKHMLAAIEDNPIFAEKTRFRIYSDTGMTTGDISAFSSAIDLSKYGSGVQKLFFETSFFRNPEPFLPTPPQYDPNKQGLYISVVSGLDIQQFSSELEKAIGKIKSQVRDFDFDLLHADLLRFTKHLKEAA